MLLQRIDNLLPAEGHKQIRLLLFRPGWQYGWKSNPTKDVFSFWHKHFAGARRPDLEGQYDCDEELSRNSPLLHGLWKFLQRTTLRGHTLVRCYANAQSYGSEGTLHTDSTAADSFTSIYYPGERWAPNWAGETVFFNKEETDVIDCIYPKPNRLVIFPGTIPHVARGVSRSCPMLRVTLMYKTTGDEWSPPNTKPT
jgi:SM-20-related protein